MDERLKQMVRRLEEYARRDPAGYRLRVAALAALGYAYLVGLAVLAVALAIGIGVLAASNHSSGMVWKLVIVLLGFAWLVARSLWVRIPPPEGIEVTRDQAPRFFATLDDVTARLQCPRVDHLLIDGDMNACAAQVPRLGVFGCYRQYVVLGMPLLRALTPDQALAVVAHELGHLSARHGRLGVWLYRVRATWGSLMEELSRRRAHGAFLLTKFLAWYGPHFSAYSFVQSRAGEYEADALAAEIAGAESAGAALVATEAKGWHYANKVMPGLWKSVEALPTPPARALTGASKALSGATPPEDAEAAIARALKAETGYDDTHPALRDRLAALQGCAPADVVAPRLTIDEALSETAADRFLGVLADRISEQLDAQFVESMKEGWAENHEKRRKARERLQELTDKAGTEPLTKDEARERALIIGTLYDGEAAIPALREFVAANPEDAAGRFVLGRALIEAEQPEGLEYLDDAMRRDPDFTIEACKLAYVFVAEHDGRDAAEKYREAAQLHAERQERAYTERFTLSARDHFQPPDLPPDQIDAIRAAVAAEPKVGRAYVVRKLTHEMAERPFYLVGVVPVSTFGLARESDDNALRDRLAEALDVPIEALVVVLRGNGAALLKPISRVAGAEIYRRQ